MRQKFKNKERRCTFGASCTPGITIRSNGVYHKHLNCLRKRLTQGSLALRNLKLAQKSIDRNLVWLNACKVAAQSEPLFILIGNFQVGHDFHIDITPYFDGLCQIRERERKRERERERERETKRERHLLMDFRQNAYKIMCKKKRPTHAVCHEHQVRLPFTPTAFLSRQTNTPKPQSTFSTLWLLQIQSKQKR